MGAYCPRSYENSFVKISLPNIYYGLDWNFNLLFVPKAEAVKWHCKYHITTDPILLKKYNLNNI
jgi:hypothetical protein